MKTFVYFLLSPFFSLIPFELTNTTAQTLPFTQNWTTTTLINSDNDWSSVPGIQGFIGSDLPVAAGTDPQTLTSPGFVPTPSVIANQSNPNALINGGVAEFDGIANPSIALQPNTSNSGYAPYIIISLNTINRQNINVAYNLRDLDGSSDNAVQPVALQYRVGNSGNFTNIPAGFVADATTGPSLATLVTAVSANLPAAANNQSLVQVRIITADAVGIDEWVGIDDINITGAFINSPPVITTTPGTTTYIYNTPVLIDNGLTVADANNTTLASANISLGTGFQPATDLLTFTADAATMGNINGSFSAGTLSLSSVLNTATLAQWQTALRSIRFSASGVPANHSVTVNFTVNDGTSNSLAASRVVAVYPSPPPVVTTTGGNTIFMQPTPVVIDNGITVTDANNATLASAVVSLSGTFQNGNDILSFTNNGSTMGNITGSYTAPLGMLSLSSVGATATLTQWQAALRSITFYTIINPQVYDRTINFTVNDGVNTSAAATKVIAIAPGLPPSITSTGGNTTYIHSITVVIDNGLTVADPDNATLYTATLIIGAGFETGNDFLAFLNNGSTMGNITGIYSQPQGILNLTSAGATATLAQWQAALRSVTYYNIASVPLVNNRTINLTVNDGNANSNTASKTITFMPLASIGQSWSPAVQVLDPNAGTGGMVGGFAKMLVVNGNPAIAYYDITRTNLVYRRATDASGTAFGPGITIDSLGFVGQYISIEIVNGNPAISYYDATNQDLRYVRALDVNGSSWAAPINVDVTGDVGTYTSLMVVNGNPAIAYRDATNADLKYVRATNGNGSAWGNPLSIDVTGNIGLYTSMHLVNGNPAITYYDVTNQDLKYIRATDASGTAWGSSLALDVFGNVGQYPSLKVINGNPAISYYDATNTDLKYISANDAFGNSWSTGIAVDINAADVGLYTSLQLVNGNPAISYLDNTSTDLKYVRSTTASGSAWAVPVTLDVTGSVGASSCLQIINGNPAISYQDISNWDVKFIRSSDISGINWGLSLSIDGWGIVGSNSSMEMVSGNPALAYYNETSGDLQFVRAANTTGSAWGLPVTIDATGNVGQMPSMQIVSGNPAISYYDATNGNLKYVRAMDALGTVWAAPIYIDVSSSNVGYYSSLKVIDGNPAISYLDVTNENLKYIRATDASGNSWFTTALVIDLTGDVGYFTCMQVINGNPAIGYYDQTNGDLKYVRANDASGIAWANPVTVEANGNVGYYPSLQSVNGNPSFSYYDQTNGDLKFIKAVDNLGATWGSPLTVDATGNVGINPSLQIVNNFPVIAYQDYDRGDVKYVSATNINGSAWGTPVVLDSSQITGLYISTIKDGSYFGISYFNQDQALPYFLPGRYGFSSLSNNYFRSKQNGNWNDTNSWESSPDNSNWGPATLTPDFTANIITIKTGHTINVTADVTVDQLVLETGSTLITKAGTNLIIK